MKQTGGTRTDQRVLFGLWALVGAGGCLALLSILSIGIIVAAGVALAALMLLRVSGPDRSMTGAISGTSLALFYVAWLNRAGPSSCPSSGVETVGLGETGGGCGELWNPWPWLAVGLVLLVLGIALFSRLGRPR